MSWLYERKVYLILAIHFFITSMLLSGCKKIPNEKIVLFPIAPLVVAYVDVGMGDCTFIKLPDNKCMMIDTGEDVSNNYSKIRQFLDNYSVKSIDYLVLSHVDRDHIENTIKLLEDFSVRQTFIPKILNKDLYTAFSNVVDNLVNKNVSIKYSMPLINLSGEDYSIYFLSPNGNQMDDYYAEFNSSVMPNADQINNLSPIIYLEYKGVRFLFTGDVNYSQENRLLTNYNVGLYSEFLPNINLENIDVLKVAHHGSNDSSTTNFLSLVNTKTAIISVGSNSYSLPSTSMINRLKTISPNCGILRTDLNGSIIISVSKDYQYKITTQA